MWKIGTAITYFEGLGSNAKTGTLVGFAFAVEKSLAMQKFYYRSPRYPVDLPVLLILEDASVSGRCREISNDGMKVEFLRPVLRDACGTLRIGRGESSLELRVRVARTGADSDGVKFLFASEKERRALQRLVALTAAPTAQPGPVLVL